METMASPAMACKTIGQHCKTQTSNKQIRTRFQILGHNLAKSSEIKHNKKKRDFLFSDTHTHTHKHIEFIPGVFYAGLQIHKVSKNKMRMVIYFVKKLANETKGQVQEFVFVLLRIFEIV
jgi:hypothetical protein